MFNFKEWLKQSYIDLVLNRTWSREYCADKCATQIDKGRFTEDDAEDIYNATEPKPEPEPEPVPEPENPEEELPIE